jgi:MerR family mercuric resistance operon transcriptional regulator
LGVQSEFGVGELSQRTGVSIETVRYYEKIGLLPPPPRTGGGHRLYSNSHVKRLVFIRRSRELGFTLREIRNLLDMADGGCRCGDIKETALARLKAVRRKIADLRRIELTLAKTAARCKGGTAPDCPIIDVLSEQ